MISIEETNHFGCLVKVKSWGITNLMKLAIHKMKRLPYTNLKIYNLSLDSCNDIKAKLKFYFK